MAPDQRYCLNCGNRRGDPRLPFMDAVVFMDAVKQQPQQAVAAASQKAPDRRPLMSANASLVAGVATLVLAIGVGVLIGRSGEGNGSNNAAATPQVIKVGGGNGEETASTKPEEETKASKGKSNKSSGKSTPAKKQAKAKTEEGSSGTSKAAEDVLEPTEGVKLPPPETGVGDKCEKGTQGCENGEFTGNFFE